MTKILNRFQIKKKQTDWEVSEEDKYSRHATQLTTKIITGLQWITPATDLYSIDNLWTKLEL